MVAYAGSTWDWHKLHYDTDYLAAKRVPAPVVDGQVFGALLAEQLLDWLGPARRCCAPWPSASRPSCSPARPSAASATVTAVEPDADGGRRPRDGRVDASRCSATRGRAAVRPRRARRWSCRDERASGRARRARPSATSASPGAAARACRRRPSPARWPTPGSPSATSTGWRRTTSARFSANELADHLGLRPSWIDSSFVGGSASRCTSRGRPRRSRRARRRSSWCRTPATSAPRGRARSAG